MYNIETIIIQVVTTVFVIVVWEVMKMVFNKRDTDAE